MKKLFKKNQIIITTLALMIAIAGYLNYSGKLFGDKAVTETSSDLANKELLDISDEDSTASSGEIQSQDNDVTGTNGEVTGTPGEAVLTGAEAGSIVAEAKVTREQVRAQNKETLNSIISNESLSAEEKQNAVNQLVSMTQLAEKEAAAETLLASKGFNDAVVSLTENSADVVINNAELSEANRAQIEDIVSRKTDIAPENIVINPVRKAADNTDGSSQAQDSATDSAE